MTHPPPGDAPPTQIEFAAGPDSGESSLWTDESLERPDWTRDEIVRVSRSRLSLKMDQIDDVLFVAPQGVVFHRKSRTTPLPSVEAFRRPETALSDRMARRSMRVLRWDEIAEVQCSYRCEVGPLHSSRRRIGRDLAIVPLAGEAIRMFLPYDDADHVLEAARFHLGGSVIEDTTPFSEKRFRSSVTLGRVVAGPILLAVIPFIGVAFSLWLLVMVLYATLLGRVWIHEADQRGRILRRAFWSVGPGLFPALSLGCYLYLRYAGPFVGSEATWVSVLPSVTWVSGMLLAPYAAWRLRIVVSTFVRRRLPACPPRRLPRRPWFERLCGYWPRFLQNGPVSAALRMIALLLLLFSSTPYVWMVNRADDGRRLRALLSGPQARDGGLPGARPSERWAGDGAAPRYTRSPSESSHRRMRATRSGQRAFVLIFTIATGIAYLGYRVRAESVTQLRRRDRRPPIVFLRSFKHDGHGSFNLTGWRASSLGLQPMWKMTLAGPLAEVNPSRLMRLLAGVGGDTAEEQLAICFRRHGPFIAIGRPAEGLPTSGAARELVSDEQWKDRVAAWMSEAKLVVLQPDTTGGIAWELGHALRRVPRDRLLFSLVAFDRRDADYETFVLRLRSMTGIRLPMYRDDAVFLRFDGDRIQRIGARYRSPFAWPLFGCSMNLAAMLAPALGGPSPPAAPSHRRPGVRRFDLQVILASLCWFLLFACSMVIPVMIGFILTMIGNESLAMG